jgi:hypothetical protein
MHPKKKDITNTTALFILETNLTNILAKFLIGGYYSKCVPGERRVGLLNTGLPGATASARSRVRPSRHW